MPTIRTTSALKEHLNLSEDIAFENVYRFLNEDDWEIIISALNSDKLVSLKMSQCRCALSSSSSEAIAHSKAIKKVELPLNDFSDHEQIRLLANIIIANNSIETLDLRSTYLTDDCLEILILALRQNNSLKSLLLDGNNFTHNGIASLNDASNARPDLCISVTGNTSPISQEKALPKTQSLGKK